MREHVNWCLSFKRVVSAMCVAFFVGLPFLGFWQWAFKEVPPVWFQSVTAALSTLWARLALGTFVPLKDQGITDA